MFGQFPTAAYSQMEWWDILKGAQVMHLEDFPESFRPIVQPIDTWFLNRRIAFIFEAKVGKGSIIVSSVDLSPQSAVERPAARQLYYSIINYMNSARFKPVAEISADTIDDIFKSPSKGSLYLILMVYRVN